MALNLLEAPLVGKGYHRECYRHPQRADRCVKVVVHGDDKETRREYGYYKHLSRRLDDWRCLPQFWGEVETNLGRAGMFDLVLDYDGQVAKPLATYLNDVAWLAVNAPALQRALTELKTYLLTYRVLTMTLKPKNIAVKRVNESRLELVLVDNIGTSDFIPLTRYVGWLARRKILRKWQPFEKQVLAQLPNA